MCLERKYKKIETIGCYYTLAEAFIILLSFWIVLFLR